MNKVNIITTPSGDKMAVLPLAEYEALVAAVEDADDARRYDGAKRRFAAGEEEAIPGEFAKRLIAGENPIRVWREYRGLSGKTVASQAGISAAFLSQIEKGEREGKLSAMRAIAKALDVMLEDIIA